MDPACRLGSLQYGEGTGGVRGLSIKLSKRKRKRCGSGRDAALKNKNWQGEPEEILNPVYKRG